MSTSSAAATTASPVLTLLSRLALAIARRRSYGSVHPMVTQADEALAEALIQHIEAQSSFAIAVANRDLLVNGDVMPANSVAVRDIATRLHLMGIGAIRFQRGLTLASLSTLVGLLARRTTNDDEIVPIPEMQGIIVARLDYEQLGLADEATLRAEGELLWQALASRALDNLREGHPAGGPGGAPGASTSGAPPGETLTLADALASAATHPAAAEAAFAALSDLAERVAMVPRTVRDTIGVQLESLFATIEDAALVATLKSAPVAARARFSSTMVDILPMASVLRWLSVSAEANGRELSPHMLRIINKMTAHQAGRSAELADQSLRETVLELVQGWEVSEPNPEEHHQLLDTLAEWSAHDAQGAGDDTVHLDPISHEAIRLVQMACEIDAISDDALQAVRYLADHGFTPQLLEWADKATSPDTRTRLRELAVTPQAIANVLLATPFDATPARQLLEAMPDSAVSLLFEPLEHCESRGGRRLILNRLHEAGGIIEPALRERLTHPMPWYLARNLLGLLRDIAVAAEEKGEQSTVPAGPLLLFQSHQHSQVRREAVRVLAHYPSTRTASLRRALDDTSIEVRTTAIDVILSLRDVELSREIVSRLLAIADQETLEASVRERALRAAAHSATAAQGELREWLVAHTTRRGLLKSVKLAPITPLVRAALHLLDARFSDHPDVAPILARARSEGALTS